LFAPFTAAAAMQPGAVQNIGLFFESQISKRLLSRKSYNGAAVT
jgi:hypothetical protein